MRTRRLIVPAALLALAGATALIASTQATALAMPVAARAGATSFKVDSTHSSTIFRIRHNEVAYFYGRFDKASGAITWDDADPAACAIAIDVDVNSVNTGAEGRNNHLKRADFFNAAQFPTLSFKSTKVEGSGDAFKVTGDLTIHGVTKPITVDVAKTGQGPNPRGGGQLIGFETTFTIKRSDFDMNFMQGPLGDEVRITIGIEAGAQ